MPSTIPPKTHSALPLNIQKCKDLVQVKIQVKSLSLFLWFYYILKYCFKTKFIYILGTVTELRNKHAQGEKTAGINVRKGAITNILEENVVQPLLVSTSAITLASETVRSILKIDDIVNTVR